MIDAPMRGMTTWTSFREDLLARVEDPRLVAAEHHVAAERVEARGAWPSALAASTRRRVE